MKTRISQFFIVGFLVCSGLCSLWLANRSVYAEDVELVMEQMSYTTQDQVEIFGSWIVGQDAVQSKKKRPVVMLLHDYGIDRRDWSVFIPDLVNEGYHVLAIDLRGHGQSAGGRATSARTIMQSGPLDVQPAFEWITSQQNSQHHNISIIGVGMGADIAYLCAGRFAKYLRAAVVISPSYNPVTYGSVLDMQPENVLFCVTRTGKNGKSRMAAETLSNFTQHRKKVVVYESSAHGLGMFYAHPDIREEIFAWLPQ